MLCGKMLRGGVKQRRRLEIGEWGLNQRLEAEIVLPGEPPREIDGVAWRSAEAAATRS